MFKKNLLLAVIVCNIVATVRAMDNAVELPATIKLPSAVKLRQYLRNGGFGDLDNRTNIATYLDSKELRPADLSNIIDTYRYRYIQALYEDAKSQLQNVGIQVTVPVLLQKKQVLECVLCELPVVCEDLIASEEEVGSNRIYSRL